MLSVIQFRASVLLTVSCFLVSAACVQLRSDSNEVSPPKPASTSSGDPQKELRDGLSGLATAYPYRLSEEFTYSGTPALESGSRVVEYAAADRVHYKLGSYESIQIGDKNYGYYGGKWVATGPSGRVPEVEEIIADHMKDVQLAGTESINGSSCLVYTTRYEFTSKSEPGRGTSKIWIATSDGLPRQLDSEIEIGDRVSKSHRIYQYDRSIKVERPIP